MSLNKSVLDGSSKVVNIASVPDNWTGSNPGDWQPPQGHTVGADGGQIGETWNGSSYDPVAIIPISVERKMSELISAYVNDLAAKQAKLVVGLTQEELDELEKYEIDVKEKDIFEVKK